MSPQATSVGFPPIDWALDLTWPVKPTVPSQGAGVTAAQGWVNYAWGGPSDSTWDPTPGTFSGGGETAGRTKGGAWAFSVSREGGGTGNAGAGLRLPMYRPALDPTNCPGPDDVTQRILWVKLWLLEDSVNFTNPAIADSLGFQVLADNGLVFASATWPIVANGGFGIMRRVGNAGYRWASYSAAPALLESTNLAGGDGWHSCDLIFRQADFGDVATPWLTLRWDELDIFTERVFGSAFLPAPGTLRAGAHSWAFLPAIFPSDTGRMAFRARIRAGRFHPDGYPQP